MRQPESGQAEVFGTPPPANALRLSFLKSHQVAVLEVSGQLSIFTGENRASHAEHDAEHGEQREEGDLGSRGHRLRAGAPKYPLPQTEPPHSQACVPVNMNGRVSSLLGGINGHPLRC